MLFTEKFSTIVSIIEKNISKNEKDVDKIAKAIATEVYSNAGDVRRAFKFITDIDMPRYIKLRTIERIIAEKKRYRKKSFDDIAARHGYSEIRQFHRDIRNNYHTTATLIINGEAEVDLMKPLTFDRLIKGNYMIKEESKQTMSDGNTGREIDDLLSILEDKEIKERISDILDSAAIYGIGTEQVLKAYSVSKEKGPEAMRKASERMSDNYPQKPADSFNDDEMDCLYLVINYGLLAEEAEKIVKDIQEAGEDVRKADHNYYEMAGTLYGEYGSFSEKISYKDYFDIVRTIKESFKESGVQVEDAKNDEYCREIIGIIVKNCSKADIVTRSEYFFDQIKWFIRIVIEDHWSDYCEHFSLLYDGIMGFHGYSKKSHIGEEIDASRVNDLDYIFTHNPEFIHRESADASEKYSKLFPYAGHKQLEEIVINIMKQNGIDKSDDAFIHCFARLFIELTVTCSRNDIMSRKTYLINFITLFVMAFLNHSDYTGERIALIAELITKGMEQINATTIEELDDSYIKYLLSWRQDEFRTLPLAYEDYLVVKEELDKINISVSDAHASTYVKAKNVKPSDVIEAGRRIKKEKQIVIDNRVERSDLISFASCLINNYVDEDYVYCMASNVANSEKNSSWLPLFHNHFNDYTMGASWWFDEITVKLASMIIAANENCDYEKAEKIVRKESGKYQIGYLVNIDWRFIEANIIASKIRPDQNYKYIPYNAFVKAAELISRKGKYNIFSIHELYLALFAYIYGPYETIKSAVDSVCSAFEKINYYDGIEPYWKQRLDHAIEIEESMQQAIYDGLDDSQLRHIEIITSKSNLEKIHEADIDPTLKPDMIRVQMSLQMKELLEKNILDIEQNEHFTIGVVNDELYEDFKTVINLFSTWDDEKYEQYRFLRANIDTIEQIDYKEYLNKWNEKELQKSFHREQIEEVLRADCGIFADPFDEHCVVFDLEDKDYTIPLFVDVEDLYCQYKRIHGDNPLEDLTVEEANDIWKAALNN